MDRLRTPSLPLPPNPSSLFLHTLLPLFLVLTAFGPGYQTISSFAIIYFSLSVYYTRTYTRWWWLFLFYIMNSIGFMLAYMETLNDNIKNYKGLVFGIGLMVNLIILIPYIFDRIAQRKFSSDGWARIIVFPCVWTGIWTIILFSSPLGDWGNYAFILLNYGDITQLASFAGLGGINFILSWSGSIGSDIISYHVLGNQNTSTTSTSSTGSIIIDNSSSIEDNSTDTVLRIPPTRPPKNTLIFPKFINSLSIYLFILFLVITYGSIRLNTNFVPFYQQRIEDTFPHELTNFGCVLGQYSDNATDDYINLTLELAISGNKLILWSEGIAKIMSVEERDSLFESIKNISTMYNTYIGFTYLDIISLNTIYNKQVVINNKGDVVIDYKKSNLVPFDETSIITKGDNKLQTFQSEDFGIIGSAICFDFDFPKLIGQTSSKNVNLMLDSSNTWVSPVGPLHARMNTIRSIENGFTTFRCNSYGISGIWDQYGQPLHYVPTVNTSTVTFQVPIIKIKNRIKTVYSIFGETFGWICVGSIGVYLIVIVLAEKGSGHWKARINYWL
ncbi:carbon-nitrogen hydrolase [Glomus cerebriforme]|uniref:Carbon-nitrogen hydrolase n=1 Tax=Glomus cerebriforme TaxID=658196 RepID=A0A397TFM7_9GLOM|nr:carbon-nitrogen hydrolase [Glomus cerebriforme]